MKIDWKRIEDHEIGTLRSCLITQEPDDYAAANLAVAFKVEPGEWKLGNGKVCWFKPLYFAYINSAWEEWE